MCIRDRFEIGKKVLAAGMMPILEPEIDIYATDKAECEAMLKDQLLFQLDQLEDHQQVILKLTLPEEDNFYSELIDHPNCLRMVALSGGYSLEEATTRLTRQHNLSASFFRAFSQNLKVSQSDEEFSKVLKEAVSSIYNASIT